MTENISGENKKSIFTSTYFVLAVLMIGVFMMMLDAYIFAPALATIVKDFNTSYDMVAWVATLYMLVSTAVMPLAGKLSDIYGRKRIFIIGVFFFTLGSLLSSLSWDIYSLIAFRGVQAIGGGIIMPAALAAMSSAAPPEKLGKTMGALMSASALAMVVGPNIGGFFIEHFGWRSVFYINLPIGIIAILLALMFRESYGEAKRHIDFGGAALLAGGLAALVLGLNQLESHPLTDVTVFPYFLATLLAGALLYLYERRTPEPILDMKVLLKGDFLSLNVAMMLLFFGMMCAMMYVSTFAQTALNMGIQDSGTILTPLSITMFIAGIVGGVLLDRFGHKPMLLLSGVIMIIAMLGMTYYVSDSSSLAVMLVIIGLGMGAGMGAFNVALISVTPGTERGISMGIMTTFRGVGGLIAPVVGGYFLNEALRQTVTFDQAFNNLYMTATAVVALSFLLIAYFVFRTRKIAKPVPVVPQPQ
ncbi:MAG TPA: MFS transporter [Methanocella sp.]|jgi:EmrB/QacA subfamily drug resistance transporter